MRFLSRLLGNVGWFTRVKVAGAFCYCDYKTQLLSNFIAICHLWIKEHKIIKASLTFRAAA